MLRGDDLPLVHGVRVRVHGVRVRVHGVRVRTSWWFVWSASWFRVHDFRGRGWMGKWMILGDEEVDDVWLMVLVSVLACVWFNYSASIDGELGFQ